MSRPSPGTKRVVDLLNFVAENPERAFTLTDLIDALKLNRATCHSVVAQLVRSGYLYRTHDKRYLLGEGAIRLGSRAAATRTPLQMANPEMRSLAETYGVVCMAIFLDRSDVVVREHASSGSNLGWVPERGTRWPLRPPLAAGFLAWMDREQAWLNALSPPPSSSERHLTAKLIDFVRRHGFQFVTRRLTCGELEPYEADRWLFQADPAQRPIQAATRLERQQTYPLVSLSAPVFDPLGRVAFLLSLAGFNGVRKGTDVVAIANRLRDSCLRIERSISRIGPADD
jgi:DNA-binding IclR family transcriptional regulator